MTTPSLEPILDKFLRKELAAWAKRFPDEFYQQILRLKGWERTADQRPLQRDFEGEMRYVSNPRIGW